MSPLQRRPTGRLYSGVQTESSLSRHSLTIRLQPHLEAGPLFGSRQPEIAAHLAGEAAAEGEAQAHSRRRARGPGGRTVEAAEDPPALARLDAGAVIVQPQDHPTPPCGCREL